MIQELIDASQKNEHWGQVYGSRYWISDLGRATGSDRVYVRSIMDHSCVSARGAKSSGMTDVTYISPRLRQDAEARKEIEGKMQELHLSSVR